MASTKQTRKVLQKTSSKQTSAKQTPTFDGLSLKDTRYLQELLEHGRAPSLKKAKQVDATLWTQGSFTIARLEVYVDMRKAPVELVGVAKCNRYDDELDEARGRKIALARAARGEAAVV